MNWDSKRFLFVLVGALLMCAALGGHGEGAVFGNLFMSDAARDRAAAERARAEAFRNEAEARAYRSGKEADANAADRAALRTMAVRGGGWSPWAVLLVASGVLALVYIWRDEVAAFVFWRPEIKDLNAYRRELDETRLELERVRDRLSLAEPVNYQEEGRL